MEYRGVIMVTAKNHVWAAEQTGLSVEEVKAEYKKADKAGIVCVLKGKKSVQV